MTPEESRTEVVDAARDIVTTLRPNGVSAMSSREQHGWDSPGNFHSHAPAVAKHGVTAVFDPYSPVQQAGGSIVLYGQCRDTTTRKNAAPGPASTAARMSGGNGGSFWRIRST